jgi:inhibitor of KinA
MFGFLPGFAYMGSVAPSIALSRRQSPRLNVPVGSVGIAGRQTGVYPLTGPGGWQLIGRTPVEVMKLGPPIVFTFHPGDDVQFEAVSSEVFDDLSTAV